MGLHQNMTNEPVSQLALREPVLCKPKDRIRTAIEAMRQQRLGCVIVTEKDRRPIGMFTESMLTQMLSRDPGMIDEPLNNHMAEQLPWVKENDPIVDVLEAMQARNVRFICVVDEKGRAVALTGQKGLMEYIADHFPEQVMVQRVGCAPYLDREGA